MNLNEFAKISQLRRGAPAATIVSLSPEGMSRLATFRQQIISQIEAGKDLDWIAEKLAIHTGLTFVETRFFVDQVHQQRQS